MKQLIAVIAFLLAGMTSVSAQSIVEHLQKDEQDKGKVKVNHSKEIDKLVNGETKTITPTPAPTKQDDNKVRQKNDDTSQKNDNAQQKPDSTASKNNESKDNDSENEPKAETRHRTVVSHNDLDTESHTVDTRKKVMRNAQKVTGYRVQVYSGGSSRNDRQKAQAASNKIKAKYPNLPVYVHFYSPSWKCRVGNFRSYEEANKVLKQMKAMGYSSACIVKGKITVQ